MKLGTEPSTPAAIVVPMRITFKAAVVVALAFTPRATAAIQSGKEVQQSPARPKPMHGKPCNSNAPRLTPTMVKPRGVLNGQHLAHVGKRPDAGRNKLPLHTSLLHLNSIESGHTRPE